MSEDRESKLRLYSLGIVVRDKEEGVDDIEVYPVEELPLLDGNIRDYKTQYKVNGVDANGAKVQSQLVGGATLIAKWLPNGSDNRITSPDVVANETVRIYRYADTDKFYWTTLFREPLLRRKETVCYMYGNLAGPLQPFNKDSSYWVEVSTVHKHIKLATTKSDGEPFAYNINLDTEAGTLAITDDIGNSLTLDSHGHTWKMANVDGSYVEVNKDIVTGKNASGSSVVLNGGDGDVNVPGALTASSSSASVNASGNVNISAGGGISLSAPSIGMASGGGNSEMSMTGNTNYIGKLHVTGELRVDGEIIYNGVELKELIAAGGG